MEDTTIFVSLCIPKINKNRPIAKRPNGVIAIFDDIIMHGKDDDVYDDNLIALIKRAQVGPMFNGKNSTIKHPQISFFVVLYSKNGVSPDPKKIQAIPL